MRVLIENRLEVVVYVVAAQRKDGRVDFLVSRRPQLARSGNVLYSERLMPGEVLKLKGFREGTPFALVSIDDRFEISTSEGEDDEGEFSRVVLTGNTPGGADGVRDINSN